MDSVPQRPKQAIASVSQADRELDEILSTSVKIAAVILAGLLIAAWFGWLEWTRRSFAYISLPALAAVAAGLSWAVVRLMGSERSRAVWLLLFLLILALLAGYQVAQYQMFLAQVRQEITDRSTQELKQIFPVQIPPMIREIMVRRTGMTGLAGYHLLRLRREGPGYLLLWAARAGLASAAAWAVYIGVAKPGGQAS